MTLPFSPTSYLLQSVATGKIFEDSGWLLEATGESKPSLIRAIYRNKQLTVRNELPGIYKFADWLPIHRILEGSGAPVTFQSQGLGSEIGLSNLWITFSGWWPEKGAMIKSGSFKETEAYSVCGRLPANESKVLVVASAGNTARSFARVCSENNIPLLLCVPEDNLDALWFEKPLNDCVKLIASRSGGDYFDAIHLSNICCSIGGYIAEGGAKNVARRDGMGTTVLSAATTIGRIPDYYYQAIGSGTGAIAAWEANLRLIGDGRYGEHKMKLMVSQNWPFIPIHDAWKARSREMLPMDDMEARKKVEIIRAKVLSNRKPPYPIIGGLYDAMTDAGGNVLYANNEEALHAALLFEAVEGIDIHPAAAVAVATLIADARESKIPADACIMLNITGGGEKRFQHEFPMHYLKPDIVFDLDPSLETVENSLKSLDWT